MTAAEKAAAAKKSLQDREKAYREARAKIFGQQQAQQAADLSATSDAASSRDVTPHSTGMTASPQPSSADVSESEGPSGAVRQARKDRVGGRKKVVQDPECATILREPANPPSMSGKELPKGFNTARRRPPKKVLSPAAREFTPRTFTPPLGSRQSVPSSEVPADVQQFGRMSL